jgi:hypothetical protein
MHTIEIRLGGKGKRFREIKDPLSDDMMLHLRMALAVMLEEQLRVKSGMGEVNEIK